MGLVNFRNVLESETHWLEGFSRKKIEPALFAAYANISRFPALRVQSGCLGINEGGTAERLFRPFLGWKIVFYFYKEEGLNAMKKQLVVVKIGSSSLTTASGTISEEKMRDHIEALAFLKEQGHDVILVSSGAVAAGFGALGYSARPKRLPGNRLPQRLGKGY